MKWNPKTTPNFSADEMACKCGKCGGEYSMDQDHMTRLQAFRDIYGPTTVLSGYRCPMHPEEAKKEFPGSHAQGKATDIECRGASDKYYAEKTAYDLGFVGIGQGNNMLHLDSGHNHKQRPALWKY